MILDLKNASESVRRKIELYSIAVDFFNQGYSFPEVVEKLKKIENDVDLINYVSEKAMHEDWDRVYAQSKEMLDNGIPLVDLKKNLKEHNGDDEVVEFICEKWYNLKISEIDLRDGSGNLLGKGFKTLIFGGIYLFLLYQITQKWYFLLIPALVTLLGLLAVLFSFFVTFINFFIHKINNEPARSFISKKVRKNT